VCHAILQDLAFFRLLTRIDAEYAEQTRRDRCPRCKGPLHVSDYPRKPRGCPEAVRQEYSSRLSFTCGRCEKRTTPASVRFFGRRVYVALALILVAPPGRCAAGAIEGLPAVSARTVKRWRRWWQRDFQRTAFWRSVRAHVMPPVAAEALPCSLRERFQGPSDRERLEQLLRFICPLSTASLIKKIKGLAAVVGFPQRMSMQPG
jgi:hypothetical protein